ncbi:MULTISPECIES: helix-turn-helix domain-containing protein [unclassified Delftia]|uniref:helix-turn-helix domain-containing protein n=1 Tax=unclassified Delftia TaxID=2613839 RepID=UPI0018FF3F82|nr:MULTISPECIES: helix-turn-helix transcriptional regulator [unclassified Delftia]MBK0110967.1 helix-turn-helix transcriptional regulator [Delftia sp. S65]MBK0116283.1 helix-turn-helix transcriptional regulator [Delftia sp. S67]MBK0129801.1 helix-turn-helix transcriptional regulator [Delftia sp. S66]
MKKTTADVDELDRLQLGQRLRAAREYVGLSQEEVAFALSISRPAVGNIEAGARKVDAFELSKLSDLYGRTVDYFLTGNAPADNTRIAFLARATQGLSESDLDELARFASFLKYSPKSKRRAV